MSYRHLDGWSYQPDRIAAATQRMAAAGRIVNFGEAQPALAGHWATLKRRGVTSVLAQDAELLLFGSWKPTWLQQRGTCVWQGTARAVQNTYWGRIARGEIVGKALEIVGEVMYGFERFQKWGRTHPWGCGCGRCPDGLSGADAAEFFATYGIIPRGVYGGVDLSKPREDLAISWNNSGVPADLIKAGVTHLVTAHRAKSLDEAADALSARYGGAICLPVWAQGAIQDRNGYVMPENSGGHCTQVQGVALAEDGETLFVFQQSHPISTLRFQPEIPIDGGILKLREGSYAVRQSIVQQYWGEAEFWLFDVPPEASFR